MRVYVIDADRRVVGVEWASCLAAAKLYRRLVLRQHPSWDVVWSE